MQETYQDGAEAGRNSTAPSSVAGILQEAQLDLKLTNSYGHHLTRHELKPQRSQLGGGVRLSDARGADDSCQAIIGRRGVMP